MTFSETTKPPKEPKVKKESKTKPKLRSFDSGHEHSIEHWLDMQRLVKEADGLPELGKRGEAA